MRRAALLITIALLAALAAAGCGSQAPASGVWGIVVESERSRIEPSPPSSPLPGGFEQPGGVAPVERARVIVWTALSEHRRGEIVARTWSTAEGLFLVRLQPGDYLVGVKQDLASWEYVTVRPDQYANVMVLTGARFGSRVSALDAAGR